MTRHWGAAGKGRCRHWEDRMVRRDDTSSRRTIRRQVRCSLPIHHEGEHRWRGIRFGLFTADNLDEHGRVRRG